MNETIWISLLGAGFAGSVITVVLQEIIGYLKEKEKFKKELKRMVFQRKTEVVENAISFYQESADAYFLLQSAFKEYDINANPVTAGKIVKAVQMSNKLFDESNKRLNSIYLYYDFSDIETKYHGRESREIIYKLYSLLGRIAQQKTRINSESRPEEILEMIQSEVETVHLLAEAYNNQICIIAEIMHRLRSEYKKHLN